MRCKALKTKLPAVVSAFLVAIPVLAQEGELILARIDSVLRAPKDMTAIEKMTLIDRDGSQKTRKVRIQTKGSELRLVRFLSPASVRGVSFLRLSSDRLYLFLPAFRKVRRIASSVKSENFMGTDFSYEDMSQTGYGEDYSVVGVRKDQGRYVLELKPKIGRDVSYGKLIVYADTSNYVVRKVELYNRAGDLVKVLTMDRVERINGYWTPRRMEMLTVKTGHRTVLELTEVKFDQGLDDKLFSERNLKRVR